MFAEPFVESVGAIKATTKPEDMCLYSTHHPLGTKYILVANVKDLNSTEKFWDRLKRLVMRFASPGATI